MTPRLSRKYEKVLSLLANESRYYTQTDIVRILKLPKYSVSRYVKKLLKKGLIKEEKLGTIKNYTLELAGKSYINTFFTGSGDKPVRSHNLKFKSRILRKPFGRWMFDNTWLSVPVKNWTKYLCYSLEGVTVEVTPRFVIFHVHEIFARDSDEGMGIAFKVVGSAVRWLANEFQGLILGEPYCNARVVTQHHALVEHPLAKKFPSDFNVQLSRMGFDHSRGVGELEAFDGKYSQDDAMKVMEFTDKLVAEKYDFEALGELRPTVTGLQDFVKGSVNLLNMMYVMQKKMEAGLKEARRVRYYISDKKQSKIGDF